MYLFIEKTLALPRGSSSHLGEMVECYFGLRFRETWPWDASETCDTGKAVREAWKERSVSSFLAATDKVVRGRKVEGIELDAEGSRVGFIHLYGDPRS